MRSLLRVLDGRNSLDVDTGTATVRRASTYTGGEVGQRLGAPKTERTAGIVYLAPIAVELLRVRQAAQAVDRLAADLTGR